VGPNSFWEVPKLHIMDIHGLSKEDEAKIEQEINERLAKRRE
jgi:hypothetical protein